MRGGWGRCRGPGVWCKVVRGCREEVGLVCSFVLFEFSFVLI